MGEGGVGPRVGGLQWLAFKACVRCSSAVRTMSKPIIIYIQKPKAKDKRGLPNADAEISFAYNQWVEASNANPAAFRGTDLSVVSVVRSGSSIVDSATMQAVPAEVTMTPIVFDGTVGLTGQFVEPGSKSVQRILYHVRSWGVGVRMADLHPSLGALYDTAPPPPAAAPYPAAGMMMPPRPHPGPFMGPPMGPPMGGQMGAPPVMSGPYHPLTPSYLKTDICDDVGAVPTRENNAGAALGAMHGGGGMDLSAAAKSRESAIETMMRMQGGGTGGYYPGMGAGMGAAMPGAGGAAMPTSGGGGPGTLSGHFPAVDTSVGAGRYHYR